MFLRKTQILFSTFFFLIPYNFYLYSEQLQITINQAYEMCLQNSSELKASRFELLAARQKISLSYWESLPILSTSLSDSRVTRYHAPDTNSINFSSTLNMPIFSGGRINKQREIQKLSIDVQNILLSAKEQELKNNCFTLFHQIQVLYLKKQAVQDMEQLAKEQHRITKTEFELGKAREIDLIDTQLNLDEITHELYTLESEVLSNEYSFRKLLRIDKNVNFTLVTQLDDKYTGIEITNLINNLYSIAEQRNTTLLQGRFAIEQARMNNAIAHSKILPNISLQATVQMNGNDYPLQNPNYGLKTTFEFPNELLPLNFSFGISTTPETEYGRSSSAMASTPSSLAPLIDKKLSRMHLLQTVEQYIDIQKDIRFGLEQGLLEYERQRRSQSLLQKQIDTLEKKVIILKTQSDIGKITRLDYLEGENELLKSRLQYLSGILTLIQLERNIELSCGVDTGELHNLRNQNAIN